MIAKVKQIERVAIAHKVSKKTEMINKRQEVKNQLRMFNNSRPFLRELQSCIPRLKGYPGVRSENRLTPSTSPSKKTYSTFQYTWKQGVQRGIEREEEGDQKLSKGKKAEYKQQIKNSNCTVFFSNTKKQIKKKNLCVLDIQANYQCEGKIKTSFNMKGLKKIGFTCTLSQEALSMCTIQTRDQTSKKKMRDPNK